MFLQPEKVPVKVYLSTDKDAPRLDRTPNCVATILKACLVTGYGDKEGAGWSLPFEDTTKGIKVFRPTLSPHADFFMKVSNDTGLEAAVQVYQNMTDIDRGILKLECSTPFKYAIGEPTSGRWVVIATDRSFWLLHETANRVAPDRSGTWLYCGDVCKNTRGERGVMLGHTGGTWSYYDTDRGSLLSNRFYGSGLVMNRLFVNGFDAVDVGMMSTFNGDDIHSKHAICSPVIIKANDELYGMPVYAPSTINTKNYDKVASHGRVFMTHSTATHNINQLYIPIDFWEY